MDIATFIGRFHPLVVHLPIGFLLIAATLKVIKSRYPQRFSDLNSAIGICLLLGSMAGVLACVLGYSLSLDGGYDTNTVFWHKWLGIGVVVVAFTSWLVHERFSNRNYLSHVLFGGFSILLLLTGHLGGNLTHGSDYLIAHAPAIVQNIFGHNSSDNDLTDIPSEPDSISVYRHIVAPALQEKCVNCHNSSKSKGGLDLSTDQGVLAGGDDGLFIAPGDLHESGLFKRITLDASSKKYMPPAGLPIAYSEIKLIEWWIKEGASLDDRLGDKEIPESISELLWNAFKIDTKPKELYDQITLEAIDEKVLVALNASGFVAKKISAQHELLDVRMANSSLTNGSISDLVKAKDYIIYLDLGGEDIKRNDWEELAQLTNLSRLKLNNSSITDDQLEFVKELKNLESLNLYGTMITDESVIHLAQLTGLKRVYLWNTKFTPEGVAELQEALPELEIVFES
ncbi:MAG: putative membrane protein [Saprospiraceae bacterium]|jgi:uncharacterized membrane protein